MQRKSGTCWFGNCRTLWPTSRPCAACCPSVRHARRSAMTTGTGINWKPTSAPTRPRRTHPPRACQDRLLSRWTRPFPSSPAPRPCLPHVAETNRAVKDWVASQRLGEAGSLHRAGCEDGVVARIPGRGNRAELLACKAPATSVGWPFVLPNPDIDPVLIRLGPIALRWYGLMYVLGLTAAYLMFKTRAAARNVEHAHVERQ